MKQHNRRQFMKGFTLIELITVTAIFGVLAGGIIAVVNPKDQFLKANDARRKSDIASIHRSLESYFQDNGRYPQSSNNRIYTTSQINWGTSWQPYMNILPKDPVGARSYVYYASADGQSFVLYASLERGGKDPQACNDGNPCNSLSTYGIAPNACGATCNYAISSPNLTP